MKTLTIPISAISKCRTQGEATALLWTRLQEAGFEFCVTGFTEDTVTTELVGPWQEWHEPDGSITYTQGELPCASQQH